MGSVKHTLSREKLPTGEQFENAEMLLAWAKEAGVLHQCLQSGVQGRIIDYRAIFKSCKKDEVWTSETGQEKVDAAEWTVTKRPHTGGKEAIKRQAIIEANMAMAQALKKTAGVTDEMLMATLTASCGEDMAKEILSKLS